MQCFVSSVFQIINLFGAVSVNQWRNVRGPLSSVSNCGHGTPLVVTQEVATFEGNGIVVLRDRINFRYIYIGILVA